MARPRAELHQVHGAGGIPSAGIPDGGVHSTTCAITSSGLNLGRWDYMASLIHFNLIDPDWVLPDRNTIPHNVPFFQNLRELIPDICHQRGILASAE